MSEPKLINCDLIKTARPTCLEIFVVGVGGTGARLLPGLIKLAKPGYDEIHVFDHDIVEPRNLLRQNFTARDIGHYKAEIMSARYSTDDLKVVAHVGKIDLDHKEVFYTVWGAFYASRQVEMARNRTMPTNGVLVISCVDTKAARQSIRNALGHFSGHMPVSWIDCGNDIRSGQVLISLSYWPRMNTNFQPEGYYNLDGSTAMPQVFSGVEDESDGCHAIDMQTVTVNNMSACAALNAASWLLHGIPFGSVGSIFSTFNSMEPIPIEKIEYLGGMHIVRPSTKFALLDA